MSTGADRSQPQRTEVVVSGATVLKAALIGLAVYAVIVAHQVILTIGLSFVFALGLDPLVTRLTRRGMGRGRAALLVFFLLELSGFATIAAVMAGGALLGVVGAILAVPVTASLKVVFREPTSARRARMAALRGEPAEAG